MPYSILAYRNHVKSTKASRAANEMVHAGEEQHTGSAAAEDLHG
jgi:hypothetical protein